MCVCVCVCEKMRVCLSECVRLRIQVSMCQCVGVSGIIFRPSAFPPSPVCHVTHPTQFVWPGAEPSLQPTAKCLGGCSVCSGSGWVHGIEVDLRPAGYRCVWAVRTFGVPHPKNGKNQIVLDRCETEVSR